MISFTIRDNLIRVISARDASRKERKQYESNKKIPQFKDEDQERDFWSKHDSGEYIDWSKAERVAFSNLKPSAKTISLRLPEHLLEKIKSAANEQDLPYQSLIKFLLARQFSGASRKHASNYISP